MVLVNCKRKCGRSSAYRTLKDIMTLELGANSLYYIGQMAMWNTKLIATEIY